MSLSTIKDPPLKATRKRKRSQTLSNAFGWRVRVAQVAFALVTAGAVCTTLLLLVVSIGEIALQWLQPVSYEKWKSATRFHCHSARPLRLHYWYISLARVYLLSLINPICSPRIRTSSVDLCLFCGTYGFK